VISPPVVVVLAAGLAAGIMDVWKFKIPNLLTLPLILTGVIYQVAVGAIRYGWTGAGSGVAESLLGVLVGMSLLIVFHMMLHDLMIQFQFSKEIKNAPFKIIHLG